MDWGLKNSGRNIVKDLKYQSYKAVKQQELKANDPQRRTSFCDWMSRKSNKHVSKMLLYNINTAFDSHILSKIMLLF